MSRLYNIPYAVENRIKVLKKKIFFFKAGKCDLFGIFDDGGFWAKGEFQEGSLRAKKTILIFTVV